jgi:cysteine protease ATG4
MAGVDFGKYKRIVQYFWDPEPTNDAASRSPIWCLGREYKVGEKTTLPVLPSTPPQEGKLASAGTQQTVQAATPPDSTASTASSVDSALAYDESGNGGEDGGWPASFLDDFEAKMWLTYRSNFPAIAKSQDPKALSSMSLSVRLRSQLVDQGGFTSDTGWGCMIRSGQSLLANSLVMLRMGRGEFSVLFSQPPKLMRRQSGVGVPQPLTNERSYLCLQMIQKHHTQYTSSLSMEPLLVESILENGLGPQLLRSASSE